MNYHNNCLEAKNLFAKKDEKLLFNHINFKLLGGELLWVQGENGSGKTTLLRQICGLEVLEQGQLYWNKKLMVHSRELLSQMLFLGHQHGIRTNLTVKENLCFDILLAQSNNFIAVNEILTQFGLCDIQNVLARHLSSGQIKRLSLARLALKEVPLWILDEPIINLDKKGIDIFETHLVQHILRGGIAIITTHQPILLTQITCKQILIGKQ